MSSMLKRAMLLLLGVAPLVLPGVAGAERITFQRALALARQGNESFELAAETLRRARLARRKAWAALLPSISARGTFTHSDREIVREFGGESVVFQKQDAFAGRLSASMTLVKGSAWTDLREAYRLAEAAQQTHRWTETTLEFEVARAYLTVLTGETLVGAARRTLESAEELLAAARARRQAGEALEVDEVRARLELEQARGGLIEAENVRKTALDALATLLGREDGPGQGEAALQVERPGSGLFGDPPADADPAQRPDLRASALREAAARHAVTGSWLEYLPTLGVAWTYNITENTGFSGDPDTWDLVFTLDWLLFDGGLRYAQRRESSSLLRDARLRRRQLGRQVKQAVRQARRDLSTARATLATARSRLTLARKSRVLTLARYRAGLATSLEVVQVDDELRQAELAVVSGELSRDLSQLELYRALGLDPRGRSIEVR